MAATFSIPDKRIRVIFRLYDKTQNKINITLLKKEKTLHLMLHCNCATFVTKKKCRRGAVSQMNLYLKRYFCLQTSENSNK